MAEIATIARPYAEALFKTGADLLGEVEMLGAVAADPDLAALADNPRVGAALVFDVVNDVLLRKGMTLSPVGANLLRTVIDNGRMAVLPAIASQLRTLVNGRNGVHDATISSAFAISADQLAALMPALERRFGCRLSATVVEDPSLIGGIRVAVGDEVLDTSVKARLQQMKLALTA